MTAISSFMVVKSVCLVTNNLQNNSEFTNSSSAGFLETQSILASVGTISIGYRELIRSQIVKLIFLLYRILKVIDVLELTMLLFNTQMDCVSHISRGKQEANTHQISRALFGTPQKCSNNSPYIENQIEKPLTPSPDQL